MFAIKSILSVLLFLITSTAFAAGPFVKGELLIQQTVKATKANIDKAIRASGGSILDEIPQIRVKRIRVPEKNFAKVKAALAKNPNFTFVEENFLAQEMIAPNDPRFPSQWHHSKIITPSAWETSAGSDEIPIAILDSGIDPDHPDLAAKIMAGYNFVANNNDTHDPRGHGTAVAGSAGAIGNNAEGVAGIAWNNPLMPLVVTDPSTGRARYSNISRAIIYAVDHGAKVVNISISGSSSSSTLNSAVNYAWDHGVLVFTSAGNSNTSAPVYPAACTNSVAVGATDMSDNKASFSNYGDWIALTAPGVSILTTINGGGYGSKSGTSFASPVTAGLAALIWSANPQLTHQEILQILKSTVVDLGVSGFDTKFGHGRINAFSAMMEATNFQPVLDTEAPSVTLTSPDNNQTVDGNVSITARAIDNLAVEKVEFRINGSLLATVDSAPFATTWDVSSSGSGYYTIEAMAFDTSGNVSLTDAVQVFIDEPVVDEPVVDVADSLPPIVSILAPTSGSTLDKKGTFVLGLASDENGVTEMKVYVDGKLKSTQPTNEIKWRWNTRKISKGAHTLRVEAKDNSGNTGFDEMVVYK